MRHWIKPTLTLAIICSISAGAITFTHRTTTQVIARREQAEFDLHVRRLIPMATHFKEVRGEEDRRFILASRDSEHVGTVVPVTTKGYGGDMTLLVAFNPEGSVHDVKVFRHAETAGIGDKVLGFNYLGQFANKRPQDKLEEINVISGSTVSSRAVISGVKKAFLTHQAEVLGAGPIETAAPDLAQVQDGVYQGSADGFKSKVSVEVTVADGKLTAAKVIAINDTPEVADVAIQAIPKLIVQKQHWKVDALSGATFTSEGIMKAVQAALEAAAKTGASATDR